MKNSNKISALILFIFILSFSVMTISGLGDKSAENLTISRQDFLDGGFGRQLTSVTAECFAGRDYWISAGAGLESGLCESIVNGVYISKDRLLSADVSERRSTDNTVQAVNEFVKSYDGAVYFVAVPTSSGVYGNMLPSYLLKSTEKQQIDSLYMNLSSDIRKIDAYNILKMLSDNYIYYRSDSKWTSYGAFCVYRTVIQKLGFIPVSYDKYTVEHITSSYTGNLYSRTKYMESKPDLLDIYEYSGGAEITDCTGYDNNGMTYPGSLYDREAIESDDMYRLYLGEKLPVVRINTDINNNKKLLVIGDDYAVCFIPFLTQHYSEIAFVSPECMEKELNKFLNPDDYGQMLFLFGIDSLDDDIFSYMR
ncbi:MAG: DHHW family protein [Ruminococcus flavefaciens]|nr:DHHW family protein [Ruminococcus flavefaciens]MCM1229703.1 DHHW family protein [Ruminococcus flavefaciens]